MKILGIDPGIARVGWGVIETHIPNPIAIAYGCITTEKEEKPENRLMMIHKAIMLLCKKYRPDVMSVEELFFSSNTTTAIGVGQSRGVILLSAAEHKVPVVSYSPSAIKRAISGDGKADKKQMEHMVTLLLKLKTTPKPDDTADALAIAMTHAYSYRVTSLRHPGAKR